VRARHREFFEGQGACGPDAAAAAAATNGKH
jgi:hypothetical protein